ncbi:GTP 3',8-cyclase MoaA [[Clostridium] fimetarium]|uniref:GTP 3',8-cyclase n=1 Tax=[Clostridium] fimetarium TaxID=99656 RepID=A0A1I0RF39_9FIRM|nr:GTP 3',8-cyclase MoaA [[Clostridium] fimetarium]SEW39484.1 cyclic pyranopterin phosphate synthase [[Clostridium] fimetarium]
MKDNCNRNIDYIRISVTDRCNMRCIYCMPEGGIKPVNHKQILTYDEIITICESLVRLGINKVKLTGGEPLVRKNIDILIDQIKRIDGIKSVTLTTNGRNLKEYLPRLIKAGLDGINISLDTLDSKIYEKITRRDALKNVLEALHESLKYDELKVKINCVPMLETDKEDIIKIAMLAKNSRLSVRFIEMMPIGLGKNYTYFSEDKIITILEEAFGHFEAIDDNLGNGPAHYYSVPAFQGKIGFISAISHQFCEQCNRVRLTSDGFLKTCLQYKNGTDLKSLLRGNLGDADLDQVISDTIYNKPKSHDFNENHENETYEKDNMSKIGG